MTETVHCEKRNVFRFFLKAEALSAFFKVSGKEFHNFGAAFLKVLAPERFLFVSSEEGRQKRDWEQERRRLTGSYTGKTSCKYSGAEWFMQEYANDSTL